MNGIICPECGSKKMEIYTTVPIRNGVKRHRKCKKCGKTKTTVEKAIEKENTICSMETK